MPIPQPQPGQSKDKFLSGCMGTLADDYEDPAQRYAVCIGAWLDKYSATIGKFWYRKKSSAAAQHFRKSVQTIHLKLAALNISFDFDDTLTTDRGQELAKKLMEAGNKIYIVTRRQEKDSKAVYDVADELGIPQSRVYFTNGSYKWKTLKRLGINEHYDNNPEEIKQIDQNAPGIKGIKFNSMQFASHSDYPDSVKNNAKAVLKWVDENGWGSCGTPVGKARVNQLANGEPISEETITRMYSYLSRHKVDLDSSKSYDDGCGKLMYDSWGGLTALAWAESKVNSFK